MKPSARKPSAKKPPEKDKPVRPGGRNVAGIDVGKKKHAAAGVKAGGEDSGPTIFFENNRAGIDRLEELVLGPLGGPKKVLVAMEATGHYWMPLYFELVRRGYEAVVLNPIQTRGKFRTRIRKTKTDKLDARSIAHFVFSGDALAARIPDEKTLELRLLTRHRAPAHGHDRRPPAFRAHARGQALPRVRGILLQALASDRAGACPRNRARAI